MKITIAINSVIDELWEKSYGLVEHPAFNVIRTDHKGDYLQNCVDRLQYDSDYIVWMEEDVFVFNRREIINMINRMQVNKYDFYAMEEQCGSSHREKYPGSRSFCMFFCIFKMQNIRPLGITKDKLLAFPKKQNSDEWQWSFFDYLQVKGMKYYPLYGQDLETDIITTVVKTPQVDPFALHTWFAREYPEHRERILKAYDLAKELYEY